MKRDKVKATCTALVMRKRRDPWRTAPRMPARVRLEVCGKPARIGVLCVRCAARLAEERQSSGATAE